MGKSSRPFGSALTGCSERRVRCRRFQAEQPATFKAPPSENGAALAFSGPNPVFGTKKGPNRSV